MRQFSLAAAWALLAALPLSPHAQAQTPSLQLCLAAAADSSPVYPTRSFLSTAREVIAVFRLGKGESYKKLTAAWIAVDVGDAAPPNYQIAKADLQLQGKDRGRFRYSQDKPLPLGKYRLEVTADGKSWKSAEFTVAPIGKAADIKQPQELLPLTKGQVWTYAFVQEAGMGGKVNLPGIAPDAEGKYRATVTLTAAATDQAGNRIESRRNGALVFEEWWQLGPRGLAATKRKKGDIVTVVDPPQVLLPWPLNAPQEWTYEPKDKSFRQAYRMWGPVPVRGPQGEGPGYVVLVEQGATTVERHFLPGVGLIREVSITALGGEMVSRQEMILMKKPSKL